MLGTHWEQEEKTQNNSHHPTPKMRKTRSIMNACWAFSLAAWNFNFQNCLSPFSTWAHTPLLKDWGTYWHKWHKCTIHSYFYGQSAFYNSHHPTPKMKKTRPIVNACWAFLLTAWNFNFQNCLSPFSTWANTPYYRLGDLLTQMT